MTGVTRDGDGFVVDAGLIADLLQLDAASVQAGMRSGAITTRCERGEGDDAGRWRLTIRSDDRAGRLVVDEAGAILRRSTYPAGNRRAGPPAMRG